MIRGSTVPQEIILEEKRVYAPIPIVEEPIFSIPVEFALPVYTIVVVTLVVDVESSSTSQSEQVAHSPITPEPLAPMVHEPQELEKEAVPKNPPPQQPQVLENDVPMRRSQRVKRSAIPNDYEVYISEGMNQEGEPTNGDVPLIMAANPAPSSGFNLRSILNKEKLSGRNFTNWYRNLSIVLKQEKKEYVLEQPNPEDLGAGATVAERIAHEKHCNESLDVGYLTLATMSPELQKQYEDSDAFNMIEGLRGMFESQERVERYNTSKALFGSKLAEGSPVSPHVIKMIGHMKALDRLGIELEPELATDVMLQSLPPSFEPFIMNYHMYSLDKTLTKLHGMLKTAKDSIKKTATHVMMIQRDSMKRKRKGKGKGRAEDRIQKPKTDAKPKAGPSPLDKCFHCGDSGHWSRNCQKYLEEKKKGSETSTSGINVIEIN
ncbi:hypothetical protein BS78_05G156200 [Paspalum vaginatum]|nr:hypothetical protein BS78_05G156200 [Paspalum vaginatum]